MKKIIIFLLGFPILLFTDPPFIPNIRVSSDVPWDTLNQGETDMAVWKDSIYLISNTAERSNISTAPFAYSYDGGQNFTQYPFIDWQTGITWHTDPVIGIDDSGHIHMLIQFYTYLLNHYLSRDGGKTWTDTTQVTGSGIDKPWMVVNNNEIYVVWQQVSGNTGIRLAKSINYGKSFSQWEILDNTGIAAITMDENEILHLAVVAWYDGIYYMKSYDKGQTWTFPLYLSDYYYTSSYGDRAPINSIAVKGNVVFITWVDTRYSGWDILAMRSEDGGNTWTGPFVVNENMTGGQCKGWSVFDPYGGLHVTYYSTPDWPTYEYSLFSFWYRFSPDSGKTFYPAIRISDTEFKSLSDFMGEYHVCRADSNYIYAEWTDGRNGDDNDLYFSKALLEEVKIKENYTYDSDKKMKFPFILTVQSASKIFKTGEFNIYDIRGRKINNMRLSSGIFFVKYKKKEKNKLKKIIILSEK